MYRAINKLSFDIFKCDVINFLTVGMMANYGLMTNLPKEITYNTYDKNRNKVKEIHNHLYRCDKNEDELIKASIYGDLQDSFYDLLRMILIIWSNYVNVRFMNKLY